jgi:hypothetical protein
MMEDDHELQDAFLSVHHACIHTLAGTPAYKIIENHNGVAFIQIAQTVLVQAPGPAPGPRMQEGPQPRQAERPIGENEEQNGAMTELREQLAQGKRSKSSRSGRRIRSVPLKALRDLMPELNEPVTQEEREALARMDPDVVAAFMREDER